MLAALLAPLAASASEGAAPADRADQSRTIWHRCSAARKLFVNYCLNCHSAGYMRYNRLRDLGLTEPQIKDNLIFTGVKVGELDDRWRWTARTPRHGSASRRPI